LIVVDASALIEVPLRTPAAHAVEQHMFAPGQTLHAPHVLDVEVAQVLRRYLAKGGIDDARGRVALDDLGDLRMQRYQHDFLLPWAGAGDGAVPRREQRQQGERCQAQARHHAKTPAPAGLLPQEIGQRFTRRDYAMSRTCTPSATARRMPERATKA
jgi:hypothetical protein